MARRRKQQNSRRKPGTGYVTREPDGTFKGHFPKVPQGYHVRRGFDTYEGAEAWCDSLVARRDAKEDISRGQQSVSGWMDAWKVRETREREWKAKMVADVEWKLGYTKPYIGNMALADVMPDDVDAIWDNLSQCLAKSTVRQIRNYLYQVFESARKHRYITYNPVIKPDSRKPLKKREPLRLSVSQAVLLLRTAELTFYYLAWWLILTLGMRAGEICGLRWCDVDLEAGVLHILQQVTDVRGTPTKDNPKNDKVRHLPIASALIQLFRFHKTAYLRRAAQGIKKGYWEEHDLVFPGRGGRPMSPTSLRHALKNLTDTAKLPKVTTHMLRHTAGKFYTDIGASHEIKQALLGHTPDITGHYAPPDADVIRPWTEKVCRLLMEEAEQSRQKER